MEEVSGMVSLIKKMIFVGGLLTLMSLSACTKSHFYDNSEPQTVYVGHDGATPIPPGVARYCWEEPVVEFQENGPGLDADKQWYVPSSVAVRMVKQGRWRPCRPVLSEVKGETKNER